MIFKPCTLLAAHLLFLAVSSAAQSDAQDFPELKGPYLGGEIPEKTPVKFPLEWMPEGYKLHSAPVFTPGCEELYFSAMDFSIRFSERIFVMKMIGGKWTEPVVASFSGDYFDGSPSMSRDGRYLFFSSARTADGAGRIESGERRIWCVKRTGGGWGAPEPLRLGPESLQNGSDISALGNLFFDSSDIYSLKFPQVKGESPESLGPSVNTGATELHPCVAPDERFLVFYSNRPGQHGSGGGDLYISFRNRDGTWRQAVNLGENFNKGHLSTSFPRLSPDGKYLFFLKLVAIPWKAEVYWVSVDALDDMDDRDASTRWEDENAVTDIDGNVYPIVKIGEQTWMAANLKVTHYRDGTPIPNVYDDEKWPSASDGAYSLADDSANYLSTYGALYNFYAVSNRCGICPESWHVPTKEECMAMIDHLGGTETAGVKIKDNSSGLWQAKNTPATNESGFCGLPAGGRGQFGGPGEVGRYATWWSSTSDDRSFAWHWGLYPDKNGIRSNPGHKSSGFSVRCIKDRPVGKR